MTISEEEAERLAYEMGRAARAHLERLWRECGGTGPLPPYKVRIGTMGPGGLSAKLDPEDDDAG